MNQSDANPGDKSTTDAEAAGEQSRIEALYDRYAERTRELFDAGQEKGKAARKCNSSAAHTFLLARSATAPSFARATEGTMFAL